MRPASTRWLEVLCPRERSVSTVALLAATGALELERRDRSAGDFPVSHLAEPLAEYRALATRYARYWGRGTLRRRALTQPPGAVLDLALARIDAWRREADPSIDRLQSDEAELARLALLARVLERIAGSALDFAALAASGPVLGTFCCILPRGSGLRYPDWALHRPVPWEDERCDLVLGPRDRQDGLKRQIRSLKGRVLEWPDWLAGDAREALGRVRARQDILSSRAVLLYAELDALFEDRDLGLALGDASGLAWFADRVGALDLAGEHLAWITGWTDDLAGTRLAAALDRERAPALLRLLPPPPGKRPPQVLVNPPWMRPFETLVRAFGIPGTDEADPTPLLALAVPLLFGYMFADVGQGAVLVGAGWWLERRGHPLARLPILGGVSAMGFGLLFGSLFAREDLIPALWVHPLEAPVAVLAVPMVFAVGLLSLGHLLSGLGALWGGELKRWLAMDLGFLVLYLGLVALPFLPGAAWVAGLGGGWYLIGAFLVHRRLSGGLAAMGHLLESAMQILVNTVSFARVGAFALAHASLGAAVATMADSAPAWAGLAIMILGNGLIIALEGLAVSIQTTRLVLFELFNRFLRGTGRPFRPLPAPPETV